MDALKKGQATVQKAKDKVCQAEETCSSLQKSSQKTDKADGKGKSKLNTADQQNLLLY